MDAVRASIQKKTSRLDMSMSAQKTQVLSLNFEDRRGHISNLARGRCKSVSTKYLNCRKNIVRVSWNKI